MGSGVHRGSLSGESEIALPANVKTNGKAYGVLSYHWSEGVAVSDKSAPRN